MIKIRNPASLSFDLCNYTLMIALIVLTLYPFLYVLFSSFSDPVLLMEHRGILFSPIGFTSEAYRMVMNNNMIYIGYLNTLLYVGAGTLCNMLLTAFGAYALSRRNVLFSHAILFAIVFTMFFSGGLMPTYLLMNELHLIDTRWALILPAAVNTMNLIIMRTSFQAVPADLEESARMDGAHDFTILFRVILPLSKPVVAVMVLFYAVHHWNSYFAAMIYLQSRELYPLQLVLREILITNNVDAMMASPGALDAAPVRETIKYATIIVSTVPVLLLYPFLQRYFVKGVMIGAIKG